MKYVKIFRILGIAIMLSLLAVAIPSAPAQAVGSITLDPERGKVGDKIYVSGEGFNKSTAEADKFATIYFSSQEASTVHDIDDEVTIYEKVKARVWLDQEGAFQTTFTVPAKLTVGNVDVQAGTYHIYVTDYPTTRIMAVAEFTVVAGETKLDPDKGRVGTQVEITGKDFAKNKDITIKYDGSEVDIEKGDEDTDNDGEFASFIRIPESTAGTHTITVGVSGSEAEAEFTVEPEIFLDPTSGEAGTLVKVSGTGFGKRKEVIIYFNKVRLATRPTDRQGSFDTTFDLPELGAGIYSVEAEDKDKNLAKTKFSIIVRLLPTPMPTPTPTPTPRSTTASLNPIAGHVGTALVINGTGFEAGGKVTIKYDDEVKATVVADANGIFMAVFKVPESKHGAHTVTASDGSNTQKLTFTMELKAPTIPTPLLPEMGAKVTSPVYFDWKDVTDDSQPVTYTLQIATNKDFGATFMVLEKEELTDSEYTLTEREELELSSKQVSYYWRVRAIDAASNEEMWSDAGEFSVAAPFAIPDWALYTLMGLGGLFLFGLGYWLGRRTTFYY